MENTPNEYNTTISHLSDPVLYNTINEREYSL
jgi:hypothetical protein